MRKRKDFPVTSSRRPVPRRNDFPYLAPDTVRYGDLDRQNHVNNAVYATYMETGRVLVLRDPALGLIVPDTEYSLARIEIDFLAEVRWPGMVEIGTAITRVGTSSLTFAQAVFAGDLCAANGETVVVLVDARTRRPTPFPADLAARIRASAPKAPGPA
jgi:acyl-CoA thioester hydrolase